MKVIGIVCPNCKDFVFSKARHDLRYCSCKQSFVDGGQESVGYLRIGGKKLDDIKCYNIQVKQNITELEMDWNSGKDKYGIIHERALKKYKLSEVE